MEKEIVLIDKDGDRYSIATSGGIVEISRQRADDEGSFNRTGVCFYAKDAQTLCNEIMIAAGL